jgi:cyclase
MYRPRIIPVLLLKNKGLVKTRCFEKPRYVGDPLNAVKIFNDLNVDEIIFLDITATREGRCIAPELVKEIGDEGNMPFAAGGGIRSLHQIEQIIKAGAEKVILNTAAFEVENLVSEAAKAFGSSTIVVSMDVKKKFLGSQKVFIKAGTTSTNMAPVEYAQMMEQEGAGELFLTDIHYEGCMQGYNLELIHKISSAVSIPVVAHGGAGNDLHLKAAISEGHASAAAAGSRFVYSGPHNAVLINYIEAANRPQF